jgi:raffinose/stachyose/melibiose transport system permease protein
MLVLFEYYPALHSLIGGFTNSVGYGHVRFVGFSNFVGYLTSPVLLPEIRNLAILLGAGVTIAVVFPLLGASIAISLPEWGGMRSLFKYLLVVPMVIPYVIVIDVWAYLLNPSEGLIDGFLALFKVPPVQWLGEPHTAIIGILLVGFPWVSGLPFLIFLGGLQNIPQDVTDAALLDGTSRIRKLLSIDVPIIIPQIRLVVILGLIGSVQNFISILLMTSGGPGNATMVPALQMYQYAFSDDQYGYGMAIGGLLFVVLLLGTGAVFRLLRDRT